MAAFAAAIMTLSVGVPSVGAASKKADLKLGSAKAYSGVLTGAGGYFTGNVRDESDSKVRFQAKYKSGLVWPNDVNNLYSRKDTIGTKYTSNRSAGTQWEMVLNTEGTNKKDGSAYATLTIK